MCTQAAKKINNSWHLIKTRDPVPYMKWEDEIKLFDSSSDKYKKYIVQNPNPKEDGYYGGINELGVSFISSFVPVDENQVSYIRRPYVRLILDASSADEAVEIIKKFNPKIGGNMFVADANHCFGIESTPEEYFIEEITTPTVKTNHYLHFSKPNLQTLDSNPMHEWYKKWTKDRYKRARQLITHANNIEDLKNLLKDRKNAETKTSICLTKKEMECCTYSAFIFDTKNVKAYYCQGNPLENEFKEYSF